MERYFAITIFGYDKETNLPVSMLIPFTLGNSKFVNNHKLIKMAQKVHPDSILLHVANIMELDSHDDLLDYMAKPIKRNEKFIEENKGKIMRDGDDEPFFSMTQTMPPMFQLPFLHQELKPDLCEYCQKEEPDDDFYPYCGEICQIKAKSQD